MLTDPLLFDLATDHRLPYYKIKLRSRETFYYGTFSLINLSKSPLELMFDGYTEVNWLPYCAGRWPDCEFIALITTDIDSIELVGFSPVNAYKTKPMDSRNGAVAINSIANQDTLSRWNLRDMGILKKKPPVIDPGVPSYVRRG